MARDFVFPKMRSLQIRPSSATERDFLLMANFLASGSNRLFIPTLLNSPGANPTPEEQMGAIFFIGYVDRVDDLLDKTRQLDTSSTKVTELAANIPLAEMKDMTLGKLAKKTLEFFSPGKQAVIEKFLDDMNRYHQLVRLRGIGEYGYEDALSYHLNTTVPYALTAA